MAAGFESLWTPEHHRARAAGARPVRDARRGGHGDPRRRAGHGDRAGAAAPSRRAGPPGAVADVGVRRPADPRRQPRLDRDRLRHAGPRLRHPLRHLPSRHRPAAGAARAGARRARRPRPGGTGRRCARAAARVVGRERRACRTRVRRLVGLRLPPHSRPDHRRPRPVPGRRRPARDRLRRPGARHRGPRADRRGVAPLRRAPVSTTPSSSSVRTVPTRRRSGPCSPDADDARFRRSGQVRSQPRRSAAVAPRPGEADPS